MIIITTGRRCGEAEEIRAHRLAEQWRLHYVVRGGRSVAAVARDALERNVGEIGAGTDPAGAPQVVVVENDGLSLYMATDRDETSYRQPFRYHPGMGLNRVKRVASGDKDWMIEAMQIGPGDRVLDATLGLGSDALVMQYAVGDKGHVTGTESSRALALMVSEGMQHYRHETAVDVERSLRRIQVVHDDYTSFLMAAPAKSFDVVYFDPMFVDPVEESSHMIPIRRLADGRGLDPSGFQRALEVARQRVVVKDRKDGPYASSGQFDAMVGGRRARIVFCIAYPK